MKQDRCVVCNTPVPEGRHVCWWCERRHSTPSDCVYFDGGNYICELTGRDCAGYQCVHYDRIVNLKEVTE